MILSLYYSAVKVLSFPKKCYSSTNVQKLYFSTVLTFSGVNSMISCLFAALDMDSDKDIVCQLCGAWFETRKGLSSHARAHLRHFGVEYSESKGSPIELLSQLMDTDDFKHKASALELDSPTETQGVSPALSPAKPSLLTLSSSSSASLLYKVTTVGGGSKTTSASSLPGPPAKRLKTSSMQVFRLSSGELMALPHSK